MIVVRDEVVIIGVKNRWNHNDGNVNNGGNDKEESIFEIKSEERGREAENNNIRQIKVQFDQNLMEIISIAIKYIKESGKFKQDGKIEWAATMKEKEILQKL